MRLLYSSPIQNDRQELVFSSISFTFFHVGKKINYHKNNLGMVGVDGVEPSTFGFGLELKNCTPFKNYHSR